MGSRSRTWVRVVGAVAVTALGGSCLLLDIDTMDAFFIGWWTAFLTCNWFFMPDVE